ncbi:MAG TPA: MarP family serine protease [Acidimicrobiales bacterium]|nr:MarP family serine protease [Acidimicrobiales bacterium]
MDQFDLVFAAAAALAVFGGYQAGFTTRVLSWLGLGVGLIVGVEALPWLLDHLGDASRLTVVVLTLAVVLLPAAVGEAAGFAIGGRLAPRSRRADDIDRSLGGLAGFAGAVAIVWLILPVLAATPGWPAQLVDDSVVARTVRDHLPDPPDVPEALRSFVDQFPEPFEALQPPVTVQPPASTGLDNATARRVATSVVKVEAQACDRIQLGTGFVVDESLVVTNAHVVAGERSTTVERDDGRRLRATLVAFDPGRDLALLSVPRLGRSPLPVGVARRADSGGVFGHPGGDSLRIAPFTVARPAEAVGKDIYGRAAVHRDILELAAALRPGDSGSALVDPTGEVVGVAFAISNEQAGVAYALATSELDATLRGPHDQPVDAGPCIK